MATAVIGGLITSTILTLFVVPVVYSGLDGLIRRYRPEGPNGAEAAESEAPPVG